VKLNSKADKPHPIKSAIGSLHSISDHVYWYTGIDRSLGETAEVVSGADSGSSVLVGPTKLVKLGQKSWR
jgi:hypothetical protein